MPAAVSTLLGFLAGVLTDVFTEGWSWPAGVGLGVLLAGWLWWEVRQAAQTADSSVPCGLALRSGEAVDAPDQLVTRGVAVPRQLPAATRHFVGREAELATLDFLLAESRTGAPGTVMISAIGGMAGIGKTTLAVLWAHRVAAQFPDGSLHANLAAFGTGPRVRCADVLDEFLMVLGVRPDQIPESLEAKSALYRSLLHDRRVLVLLDNAADAEQVQPLLPGSPGCLLLITSRSQITSLVASQGARLMTLDLLTSEEASELMTSQLGSSRVNAEPDAVQRIIAACARLPLALALVAARCAAHPEFALADLADDLETGARFDALARDDPAAQVRTAFSWSYQALTVPAARLFRLLSLHYGPDIGWRAAASLAALPDRQVQPLLEELTRANLVKQHRPGRYQFHDLLRAYAVELTRTHDYDDEPQAALRRLLDYYLLSAMAGTRQFQPMWDLITITPASDGVTAEAPSTHDEARAWFTAERKVLLDAVFSAGRTGLDVHAWHLAWGLYDYLLWSGNWPDMLAVAQAAVAAAERLDDQEALARHLSALGRAQLATARYDAAETTLGTALEIARCIGYSRGEGLIHNCLGMLHAARGHYHKAIAEAQLTLELFRTSGFRQGQARALGHIGWVEAQLGDYAASIMHCQQALEMVRELRDIRGECMMWDTLGFAHQRLGDYPQALSCYQRSLAIARAQHSPPLQVDALDHLGDIYNETGEFRLALEAWQHAHTILSELQHPDLGLVEAKIRDAAHHVAPR